MHKHDSPRCLVNVSLTNRLRTRHVYMHHKASLSDTKKNTQTVTQNLARTTYSYPELSRATKSYLELPRTTRSCQKLPGTTKDKVAVIDDAIYVPSPDTTVSLHLLNLYQPPTHNPPPPPTPKELVELEK